jgi:hypothetical protein
MSVTDIIIGSLIAQLDEARRLGIGSDAKLCLLTEKKSKGYSELLWVTKGWTLEDLGIGQYQRLHIMESQYCQREFLKQAFAFAINNKVYGIVDGVASTAPEEGAAFPEWQFVVEPLEAWP